MLARSLKINFGGGAGMWGDGGLKWMYIKSKITTLIVQMGNC